MPSGTRKLTGTLKSRGLDYFLHTEDAEFFLLNMAYIYRRLIGCVVVVEGIQTGIDTLLVKDITLAP